MGTVRVNTNWNEQGDAELMEAVKNGSDEAFGVIVERHQNSIVNYITSMLRDRTKAMDIAQETFIRAYRAAARYQPIASVATWLHTIATNLAISEIRRERRWSRIIIKPTQDIGASVRSKDPSSSPEGALVGDEIKRRVREAVQKLPPKYRTVITLRDLQDLSYEEIEKIIGCPLGTVKSRVNRGRIMLKEHLKDLVEA